MLKRQDDGEYRSRKNTKSRPDSSDSFPRGEVMRGEWPTGLYSLRQVTEVKLGRVRSDFGWVTSEA